MRKGEIICYDVEVEDEEEYIESGERIYIILLLLLSWEVIINDDDEVETHNPVGVIAFHTRGIKLNVSGDG